MKEITAIIIVLSLEDVQGLKEDIAREALLGLKPFLEIKQNKVFTLKTLAEYLHVPKNKSYNMTHLKEIPYLKVGNGLRFRKADLAERQ